MKTTLELMRRIRIDSGEDVVRLIAIAVVYGGLYYGLPKLFPKITQGTARIIAFIAALVVGIVLVFVL